MGWIGQASRGFEDLCVVQVLPMSGFSWWMTTVEAALVAIVMRGAECVCLVIENVECC